ncbi:MAG: hypothetical protein DHS20C18_08230 [Saprospiraceae bacterium]|nr:MAG: hypothetical protein DHS20C18_08230 [Saprospiraceae bacterium]
MKKFFSVLALFMAFSFVAFAQETTIVPEEQTAPQDGPQMVFEADLVDYGTIEQGSDPYRYFNFSNPGMEPLVITHAKGSCGCTVPTYPKEPILPGETGQIKVRYDTNRLGPFTKRVTLTTNIGEENVVLTIKGKVEKKPDQPEGVPSNEGGLFNNN